MECKIDYTSNQILFYDEHNTLKYKFERSELKLMIREYLKKIGYSNKNWNGYDVRDLYNLILEENKKIKKSEARKIVSETLNISDKAVQKHIYKKDDEN